jgi:metal-responsive CopG/Arc/MetJ family transcriptional regulator
MRQMNLQITPAFDEELTRYMRLRKLPSRSEAVRTAVHEALQASLGSTPTGAFAGLVGFAATGKEHPARRFRDDDDLWGE